jgi:hypothetical protein
MMIPRHRIYLPAIFLLFPAIVIADPEPWMKKENSNELAIVVYLMFECPFSKDEISAITDDLLTASGIEKIIPNQDDPSDFPALSIVAKCAEIPGGFIYDYDIDFISFSSTDDGGKHVVRLGSRGLGSYGQGGAETVRNALRRYIEGAIADYVASNVDLRKSRK